MVERFGSYTLIEQIGVGGMAQVFLARHSGLAGFEKDIVIKRIRPHLSESQEFVDMFLGEAKLAAQLSHPNIVQIYDLGRIKDCYFIAMEYVAGCDLSALIPKCKKTDIPLPVEYALKISSNICEALHYAHSKCDPYGNPLHIVHRDVSPENIRIAWTGAVKMLDFGIAKAATQLHQTKAGEIKGKLIYMSPEQVMGKKIDHRSDIFSLGVVLYECLSGLRLFSGESDLAIMQNIVEGKINPPSYFRDDVPEEAEEIIMKALQKDRKERYQSVADMQLDIDSFLSGHEFTPSSIHLSNFIKQLFQNEIELEQEKRLKESSPETPHKKPSRSSLFSKSEPDSGENYSKGSLSYPSGISKVLVDFAKTTKATDYSLIVNLKSNELDLLEQLASTRGISVNDIVRDMIEQYLKYID